MSQGELENLAERASELTSLAREALRGEIARRGLAIEINEAPAAEPERHKLITLRRFRDSLEATLAKSILDSASIPCYLADENTVRMDWFYSNAIGGIKLWVIENDAQAATALLDAEVPPELKEEDVEAAKPFCCPRCQSADVLFLERENMGSSGTADADARPVIDRWKCGACGHDWQDE